MEIKYSLKEMGRAAKDFWAAIADKKVIAFHGNLGAGKTTFIHALCDVKAVKDAVGSPTFSIINEYEFEKEGYPRKIFHIDLFRIKDEVEARNAGVEDCLFSDEICLVEWPERAPSLFPDNTVHVYFEQVDDFTRIIRIRDN